MAPKNPFKFLDSYTKEDIEIFFGREKEIEEVYAKVFQSKLLLIYGASGTGKSSLIHCGVANKFQEADWLPVNIRRGLNINTSLVNQLNKLTITPIVKKEGQDHASHLTRLIKSIYLDYFKPVYLIFDQFEELFIFGDQPEWNQFISSVKAILDAEIQVKLIFLIRGEYLEYLSEFEEVIPDFFNNRIRIEKMRRVNALQCIEGPCKAFNIKLEENFAENLLYKLSPETAEIELTYLQVFLDRIFKIASAVGAKEEIVFTNTILNNLGKIGDVLSEFLEEQIEQIPESEKAQILLKAFVTSEGTKKQISVKEAVDFADTLGMRIPEHEAELLIQDLANRRIIKDKDEVGRYELRHDSIALRVFQQITQFERDLIEVKKFIDYAYEENVKRNFQLNESDLAYILPYEEKLHLKKEIKAFIEECKKIVSRKKRSRKQLFTIVTIIVILLVTSLSLLIYSMNQTSAVKHLADVARIESAEAQIQRKIAVEQRSKAERSAEDAKNQANIAEELRIIADHQKVQALNAQREADKQKIIALQEKERAEIAGNQAVQNALEMEKQKLMAEHERQNAQRLRMLSLAQSLGAKSQLIQDQELRALLALQAYIFNQKYEGYPYQSDIYGGLFYSTIAFNEQRFQTKNYHHGPVKSIQVAKNYIFSAGSNGTIMQTDFSKGFETSNIFDETGLIINCMALSNDNKFLAIGSEEGIIQLYDLNNGMKIKNLKGHEAGIWALQFTSDNKFLISGGNDKKLLSWDLKDYNASIILKTETIINSITINPDNKIAIALENNKILILGPETNRTDSLFNGINVINKIAFNNSGNTLAAGDEKGIIYLWDLYKKNLFAQSGHNAMITDIKFRNDDQFLLTSSLDGKTMLWNMQHLNERPIVLGDAGNWLFSICFSQDGQYIFSGDANGFIHYYPVEMKMLTGYLCKSLTRNLTEGEWNQYIGMDIPHQNTCESLTLQ